MVKQRNKKKRKKNKKKKKEKKKKKKKKKKKQVRLDGPQRSTHYRTLFLLERIPQYYRLSSEKSRAQSRCAAISLATSNNLPSSFFCAWFIVQHTTGLPRFLAYASREAFSPASEMLPPTDEMLPLESTSVELPSFEFIAIIEQRSSTLIERSCKDENHQNVYPLA
uniref:Uncharacterized protein n=1 Tax=Vespula pensylvanica TaxID=30213 RepID=A0A834P573_VESPE|nr:hypothetical protein H0235_005529 [Vespula pensylvanica]